MMTESDIKKAFELFDNDGNGELDAREVADAMFTIGMRMTKDEIKELVFQVRIVAADFVSGDGRDVQTAPNWTCV
jgi:Ca2+-binding EF-hand superfamily protein